MDVYEGHLEAALGYLHLGMPEDAMEELDLIPQEWKTDPRVLRARAYIHCEMRSWEPLRTVAAVLVSLLPDDSQHWIWLAYATRRFQSIADAERILLEALGRHPDEPLIRFNLACYAAQMDEVALARQRLQEAIQLDPAIAEMAKNDPDLGPLWQPSGESGI